jgi:glycosyltransferase involved in cell wall biosynthesis
MVKPYISIVLPCYNEEAILKNNVATIIDFLNIMNSKYLWEILIIDDGSLDQTGKIADEIEKQEQHVRVIHHPTNLNLGNALKTGFLNAKGEIIVVLDIDLSYSVEHIEKLVDKLIKNSADIVIASPYMKGGKVTAVPFLRKVFSRVVNKFMSIAAQDKYYTFTGMVRAYKTSFIRSVNLKTKDYEINPEILYKSMILRARIVEIPAHLDWTEQNKYEGQRTSKLRLLRSFFSGLMSAFIFRPYVFFIGFGSVLIVIALFELLWLLYDTISGIAIHNNEMTHLEVLFSSSLKQQYSNNPQTFIVGGITFLAAILFFGFGFISLQNKRYFEELFHLGTSLKAQDRNTGLNQNVT